MDKGINIWVGLDVHKETIAIAVAHQGREAAQFMGEITHDCWFSFTCPGLER